MEADAAKSTQPTAKAGRLYVVSAPSGAGKTSLVKALMEREPRIRFSVSYTTRKPRPNEVPGRDYHFVTPDDFERMVARGEFLEHAQVFDNCYGTGVRTVGRRSRAGSSSCWKSIGRARPGRGRLPEARSIFILPPTRARTGAAAQGPQHRLREVIRRRLQDAQRDIAHWMEFDYVVINDRFEQAVDRFAGHRRRPRRGAAAQPPEVARLAVELLA